MNGLADAFRREVIADAHGLLSLKAAGDMEQLRSRTPQLHHLRDRLENELQRMLA